MEARSAEENKKKREELVAEFKRKTEEIKQKNKEINEVISEGKGVLALETPIMAGEEEVTELEYDFTRLTGLDYTDAMDSDLNAQQIYRITYRQALALFAKAAAKETSALDMRDILERIGATDALEGVQLATLFFTASTRAGKMRISRKS
jgi:seryl-tRNA synthetase